MESHITYKLNVKAIKNIENVTYYALIVPLTYVRWHEDALKKDETCCHSKIPMSYTVVVFLTEKNVCFIVSIETQRDVFD